MKFLLFLILWNFFFLNASKIPTVVLDLNEKFLHVMDNGFWFVKFYAPWCAHCKRLAPTWEHMGHALADQNSNIRIGKVDCTRFPSVASALNVGAYPTLIFFRNGIKIPYEGERQKENMIQFALKSSGPVILNLESLSKLYELKKLSAKDPFFVLAKNEESKPAENLVKTYELVAEELFTEVCFISASKKLLSTIPDFNAPSSINPIIFVVKDNHFEFYDEKTDLRDWINAKRWPLLPQVTSSNIYNIANSSQKKLVIMVGDGIEMIGRMNLSTVTGRFFSMFKKAAILAYKNKKLQKIFQFGWIDDISLMKNVIMGELELPNIFILNLTSYEFYLNDDSSSQITENSLQIFLQNLADGNVAAQGGRSWPTRIRRMIYEIATNVHDMFYHQPILTLCLFGVPLAFFSIIFYSVCFADFSVDRNEIYPDDEVDEDEYLKQYEGRLKDEDESNESLYADENENEDLNSETELINPKNSTQKKSD